jgi:anti-sigma B factor antagonist
MVVYPTLTRGASFWRAAGAQEDDQTEGWPLQEQGEDGDIKPPLHKPRVRFFALGIKTEDNIKTIGFGERTRVVLGWREGGTLEIEVTTQDGVKVVKVKGRMSIGPTLDRFDKTVSELLEQGRNKIVLDVLEVPQIDSSGIGMLVRHLATAKKQGGAIRLLKPSKFAMHTLKIVGLLNLFSTYEDLPQAIASFQ